MLLHFINIFSLFFILGCAGTWERSSGQGSPANRKKVVEVSRLQNDDKAGALKKRIVILPFLDGSGRVFPPDWKDQARQDLTKELNLSGQVMVLDPNEVNLKAMDYIKEGQYDLISLSKVAQNSGITAIVEGVLKDFKLQKNADAIGIIRNVKLTSEVQVQMRMVLTRTGREVYNTLKTVTVEDEDPKIGQRTNEDQQVQQQPERWAEMISEAFLDFTPQLIQALEKISWEGRVAAIQGDRLFLNVGRISGLQIGDLLKVSDEAEDIYDPETGKHLGRVPGRLKGTLEVVNYFGQDGAIAVIHSGAGFQENDRVELY